MDPEEAPPPPLEAAEAVTAPPPTPSPPQQQQQQQQQEQPQPPVTTSAAAAPSSSETPAPAPTPSSQQPKPQFQPQPLQRPPVPLQPRARPPPPQPQPQQPYPHFHQHVSTSPATSSPSVMAAPPVTSNGVQRGGLAIGVPAHHHAPRAQQGGPVPFSSFGPAPSFGQSFGGMQPRSSIGVPEQLSNSNAQGRPPIQGIQTIGMVGSLSTASHVRLAPASTQHQQRPGQPPLRSITSGNIAATPTQKLANQGMARASSMGSPASPAGAAQNSQPLQQPWMSTQTRPLHASSLSSTSYRPQVRPQGLQQRPIQQQQQHSLPQKQQQQHSLAQKPQQQQKHQQQHHHQISLSNHSVMNQSQQQAITKNQQGIPQQQQLALRVANQKAQNPATGQSDANQPGAIVPVVSVDDTESGSHILSKRSIHELVMQIDPSEKLDPEVEDILVEIADDFIESVTTVACSLAKHRKSTTLEAKDVLLHLERNWNMSLPGFGGDDIKSYKKPLTNEIHKERLAVIKKSMAGSLEAGNMKNSIVGQHNANVKSHVAKASVIGSPKLL